ncbi:MAG: tetraacyldisaccharide 4'-kinase [Pseudomonadota bacterium]
MANTRRFTVCSSVTSQAEPSPWLYRVWYADAAGGFLLRPLGALFRAVGALRRAMFRKGWLRQCAVDVPVIVVGNIAVGGAGKTPLVAWLATHLAACGRHPVIVSRGYGGEEPDTPVVVTSATPVEVSGDEALMLARRCDLPVVVCRDRCAAAGAAVAIGADVIIADDGLQHYAMLRDAEIVVVDSERLHGNGRCLPAGPLREPVSRLADADLVVYSSNADDTRAGYRLNVSEAINAKRKSRVPLSQWRGQRVHAIAGIGHPERFFSTLEEAGLSLVRHAVADHGTVDASQLNPDDGYPVLMTEKDAVKYDQLSERHWIVPATVQLNPIASHAIERLLDSVLDRSTGSVEEGS